MSDISPLFAVEAEELLNEGKYREAIELCKQGLEVYPEYDTAKLILSKALKLNGMDEEAHSTVDEVINKKPHYKLAKKSLDELSPPERTTENNEQNETTDIENSDDDKFDPEELGIELDDLSGLTDDYEFISDTNETDSDIDEIVEELESTDDIQDEEFDVDSLINETKNELDEEIEQELDNLDEDTQEIIEEVENSELVEENLDEEDFDLDQLIDDTKDEIDENTDSDLDLLDEVQSKRNIPDNSNFEDIETTKDHGVDSIKEMEDMSNFDIDNEEIVEDPIFDDIVDKPIIEDYRKIDFSKLNASDNSLLPGFSDIEIRYSLKQHDNTLLDILDKAFIEMNIDKNAEDEREEIDPSLVSDTFANILVQQGAYGQAIEAYNILAEKEPDKKAIYLEKIEELKNRLENEIQ